MLADEVRLQHMLDAARQAVEFIEERSRNDLDTDTMLMLALTRLLEIIGEAARCKNFKLITRKSLGGKYRGFAID